MLRCDVCDSSEVEDTLAYLGLDNPIKHWVKLDSGEHRCNRCHDSIQETVYDYEQKDPEEDMDVLEVVWEETPVDKSVFMRYNKHMEDGEDVPVIKVVE